MRWLLLIGLFTMHLAMAQKNIRVQSYDVDQGLPINTVWDLTQDKYGFIWVSTADGLSRFDGYTFHNHRMNSTDSSAIRGQAWHSMAFDGNENMWIAHENGIDWYGIETGKFSPVYTLPAPRNLELNKFIHRDAAGNIYAWIIGEGLLIFDSKTKQKIKAFQPAGEYVNTMVREGVAINAEKIWMTQGTSKIIEFDTKKEVFNEIAVPNNWAAFSIFPMADSLVLMGTNQGLVRFNPLTGDYITIPFNSIASLIAPIAVTSILKESESAYWVGTNKGLFVYNDATRSFTQFIQSFDQRDATLVIQKLFKDKSGNIWVATNGSGLKRYAPNAPQWKLFRADPKQNDIVKSIYADGSKVYVGYFQKGLDIFNSNGSLEKSYTQRNGLPSDNVYVIKPFATHELFLSFLASPANSFGILNTSTGTFTNLFKSIEKVVPSPLPLQNHFPSAVTTKMGDLIFTYQNHLLKMDGNKKMTHLKSFDEILNVVQEDSEGQLWIGTMNGLYTQTKKGDWQKISHISRQVKTIAQAFDGKLWIGTVSGLFNINKSGKILTEHHTGELANDFIYGILKDNNNDMWFSHNRGLTRYSYRDSTFKHFSVEDGLQANEFNTGAFFKSASGELFFGGVKGTNAFYPSDISMNHITPHVRFTHIEIQDKPVEAQLAPWALQEIVLRYPQNTLTLEFAALEFTEPSKNKYRWRMRSLDNDWIEAGSKRQTRYANLAPGSYVFEVKASNNDGVWNELPTVLKITVLPPWWLTWWFKTIFGLGLIATIGLIAFLISRQRYKRKISELLVQQKIQKDRDRISRDLHDNVGSMVSFVSSKVDWLLKNNGVSGEAAESLQQIKANASAIMGGLRETIWAISDKSITNTDLADKLKVYFKAQLLLPSEVSDEIAEETVIPHETALHIYRSCQEIINNINKHSCATQATMRFSDKSSDFEVAIQDNGIGISNEDFNKPGHYGLKNIRERLEQVSAQLKIETGKNGTTVTITLNSAKSLLVKLQ